MYNKVQNLSGLQPFGPWHVVHIDKFEFTPQQAHYCKLMSEENKAEFVQRYAVN